MALWPNARYVNRSPNRFFGNPPGLDVIPRGNGDRMNRFLAGEGQHSRWASTPDGYGMQAYVPPIFAGSMSAHRRIVDLTPSANLLSGGPMTGTGTVVDMAGSASLSMVVSMSGTGAFTLTGTGALAMTIKLSGTASVSFTGSGSLAMIVPISGTGSVVTFTGSANLKGRLSLSGSWTPFTALSPEGLASALWGTPAAQANEPGTMGEKLNDAGSASNPWTEVIESGYTAAEVLRIIAAVAAGKSSGGGTAFRDLGDTKNRVAGTVDGSGNRTSVTLDVG